MGKLLPIICLVLGLGAGVGAGVMLAPGESEENPADKAEAKPDKADKDNQKAAKPDKSDKEKTQEYLRLTKQFVVPVVTREEISALVTMSLSLEVRPGIEDVFYEIEPKLRDRFLQVLFDHANSGGFDGAFTRSDNLAGLRKALLEVAQKDLGQDVFQVLILSISRQDT